MSVVFLLPHSIDFQWKKLVFNFLARADELLTYPEDGLIATVKKIKEKPDEIKRVIRAGIKANRYIRANREGTVQFLMEWLKLNREAAGATYDSVVKVYNEDAGVCDKGLRLVIDETKKTVKSSREMSFGDVVELAIF